MYTPVRGTKSKRHPQVVVRPWLAYTWALLPLIFIIVPSILFNVFLRLRGTLPAPTIIADFAVSEPRRSAQVVALLGSILASGVKFGLNRAFALTARKRFTQFQSLFELEDWISFTNGWMVFPAYQPFKRWRAMLASIMLMLIRGLLTSSFVSVIAPLPVKSTKQVAGDFQVDFSANIPSCVAWNDERRLSNRCDGSFLKYKNFTYQNCESQTQQFDVLEAGKASMLSHILASPPIPPYRKDFVSTFPRLENTRILGSTAGVIPMGPGGIDAFSTMLSLSDIAHPGAVNSSETLTTASYALTLQGIWAEVSCKYVDRIEQLPWPPILKDNATTATQPQYTVKAKCPDPSGNSTVLVDAKELNITNTDSLVIAHSCANNATNTWDMYLRSAVRLPLDGTPLTPGSSPNEAYAGIGSMSCTIKPQLRNIKADYDASIKAFTMTPTNEDPAMWSQPTDIFTIASAAMLQVFNDGDLYGSGNLVASLIESVAESRYELPLGVKDDRYPALIASMIKGMFEYEATHFRLISVMSVESSPKECRSSVLGTVSYHLIGWNSQGSSFILALVPIAIIALMILVFTFWAMCSNGMLTVFDPTSPVSLVASASAGGLYFDSDELADLHGNEIRRTRIKYDTFKDSAGVARWGLVQRHMARMYT